MCWYTHEEPFVPHTTIIEKMVRSTSNANNVYRVIDNNNNLYRTMVTNAIRMNQSHVGQCLIIDEEPNADMTRFFLIF